MMLAPLLLLLGSAHASREIPLWKKSDSGFRGHSMRPGERLFPGEFLLSANCAFQAIMQPDGNFVIYKNVAGISRHMWNAGTDVRDSTTPQDRFFEYDQHDGRMVVYDLNNDLNRREPVWVGGFGGNPPVELVLQNDGNLCHFADLQVGPWWCISHDGVIKNPKFIPGNACHSCHSVELTHMVLGTPQDTTTEVEVLSLTQNNCGVGEKTITRTIQHSSRTETSEEYSFGRSMSDTFSGDVESSVGITSSVGASFGNLAGSVDVGVEVSASLTARAGFSRTTDSNSNEKLATKSTEFHQDTLEIPIFVPANKLVTFTVVERWGVADVSWTATGTCFDENGVAIETAPMRGTFQSSQYRNLRFDCDKCDEGFSSEDTGCKGVVPAPPPAGPSPSPGGPSGLAGPVTTPAPGECAPVFGTCGGFGHKGPTCCVAGAVCVNLEHFSMCQSAGSRSVSDAQRVVTLVDLAKANGRPQRPLTGVEKTQAVIDRIEPPPTTAEMKAAAAALPKSPRKAAGSARFEAMPVEAVAMSPVVLAAIVVLIVAVTLVGLGLGKKTAPVVYETPQPTQPLLIA